MTDKNFTILYGSETGTAQSIAERLWREAKCYLFHCTIWPMDDYKIQNLINEHAVVFICSTTGQGDQPDNMKKFWKFLLRKSLPSDSLKNITFALLGLGDSSYVKFNFTAKMLYRRLLQLNAKPLIEPGYADEQHDLGADAVVEPWISKFWLEITRNIPDVKDLLGKTKPNILATRWKISILDKKQKLDTVCNLQNEVLIKNNSAEVVCTENKRVTPSDHFQDTRLIRLTSENLNYGPGDILMVKPNNSDTAVKQFFDIFSDRNEEINENVIIKVENQHEDMPVPYALQFPVRLGSLLKEYWDLNMVPRRYAFELLSKFTDTDLEREKLIEFTSAEGQQELYNYCNRPKRTILEVLNDFPHAAAKIPLEYLFELMQPIRPRAFSIASSSKVHLDEIHILVTVVQYKTNLKIPRIGLCSNWLSSLASGEKTIVYLRHGTFSFPNQNASVIMVGPGTGIAPFRNYIHENSTYKNYNKNYLFFGCRNKNADFYFEDEWSLLSQKGVMQMFTAFSRDQPEKIYVQHIIENNNHVLRDPLNEENLYIFVAGNSKNMPDSVKRAFIVSYAKYSKKDENTVGKMFKQMEMCGRYQTETWS